MNTTIDDFFNEINDLEKSKPKQAVWQECYDELTGYSYYWNTKTDEVTWTTPSEFKSIKEQKKDKTSKKKQLYVPPRVAPQLPSTSAKVSEASIKIYSIGDNSKKKLPSVKDNKTTVVEKRKVERKPYRKSSDSEDEKIELISSYGGDTESEGEESDKPTQNDTETKKGNDSNHSDDDDVDILTKIQKRAKELKEMGGDLPPEVATVVNTQIKNGKPSPERENTNKTSLSLVVGYSDSEEEQENEEVKSLFPIPPEAPKVAHSTLFPITKPIDVKDFVQEKPPENKVISPSKEFDSKAFQRKRRIGIALVNTGKKKEEEPEDVEVESKGLGFKGEANAESGTKENLYGFRKGGVMFVKSEVLNPSLPKAEENNSVAQSKLEEVPKVKRSDVEDTYSTLMEKLGFLSEGRPPVSPVQVMIVQAETLFTAMKEDGLKLSYLQRWLAETHADLIKLEKDAAPEGWLLQWDRSHKRYYYQNQTTSESQWEYPHPDISRCDEAMDISTTPPPIEPSAIQLSPPLPPIIRSPTPPPPPIISKEDDSNTSSSLPDVPLPPEPEPPGKFMSDGEPLPPGVDMPEIVTYNKPKEKDAELSDPLFSALDSFYSDIASMENPNSSSPPPPPPPIEEENKIQSEPTGEPPKKKKKTKVKLAPGLSMKKKGVSQLVEKWKNVQQHYND